MVNLDFIFSNFNSADYFINYAIDLPYCICIISYCLLTEELRNIDLAARSRFR